jgi:hypothetical protein
MSQDPPAPDQQDDEGQKKHIGFFGRLNEHKEKAKHGFQVLKEHIAEESDETKVMLDIYHRSLEGKASKEELREANEQFKDLLRIAGLGTLVVLPGSLLLIPLAVAGANRLGIRLLPSSFVNKQDVEPEPGRETPEA